MDAIPVTFIDRRGNRVEGFDIVAARCANCGTMTPIAELLRDRRTGEYHCIHCPGEEWLRRRHGAVRADALASWREHQRSLGEAVGE